MDLLCELVTRSYFLKKCPITSLSKIYFIVGRTCPQESLQLQIFGDTTTSAQVYKTLVIFEEMQGHIGRSWDCHYTLQVFFDW